MKYIIYLYNYYQKRSVTYILSRNFVILNFIIKSTTTITYGDHNHFLFICFEAKICNFNCISPYTGANLYNICSDLNDYVFMSLPHFGVYFGNDCSILESE